MLSNIKHRIQELPQTVADKIAAGEVVERPLSIVKELLENAVDSGADTIMVEIRNGGKSYIRVTDNGSGIDSRDIELAIKRHATSKIETSQDLEAIQTLGFRGEALSSISAVTRMELISRTPTSSAGIHLVVSGGLILEKSEIGCPIGTTIIVSDLFYNTPARLKFMKTEAAETALIIDFVSKMALAYAALKIRLINNGHIVFSTSGKDDLYENILSIFGTDLSKKLLYINQNAPILSMEAYIAQPAFTQASRRNQVLFVNGRLVSNKLIDQAIVAAYREKIPDNRYPAIFLFLRLPPEQLDVNIHPNKKEVRFDDEKGLSAFIIKAISEGLAGKGAIPELTRKNVFVNKAPDHQAPIEQLNIKQLLSAKREMDGGHDSSGISSSQIKFSANSCNKTLPCDSEIKEANADYLMRESNRQVLQDAFDVLSLTVTGIIFDTYITAVDDDHFYLIDQHAAHERVFYEAFMSVYLNKQIGIQAIIMPFTVTTSYAISETSDIWISVLKSMGYDLTLFGPNIFRVNGIPVFMNLSEAQSFLEDFLDNLSETTDYKDMRLIEKIITHACKSSVKAHDKLKSEEVHQLLVDLSKTEKPGSCPHGRPVYIKLSLHEIERMFKRV